MNDNVSLFGMHMQMTLIDTAESRKQLDVVKADFIEVESLSWEALFDGFDTLYAITYSSGIDFICKMLKKFSHAEIIFGFDEILSVNPPMS